MDKKPILNAFYEYSDLGRKLNSIWVYNCKFSYFFMSTQFISHKKKCII